ncbi:hypothetical protein SteCoe_35049 [Stentor coeruleus]|uniref:PDEase domain-containing protein n=1 Tax=Stentor coeruleus TaxID=5963 RepID=A0A1R2AT59_9CILI|nr:hypothetical protein SteCoe_35049 [Stentor coeruleus]
MTTPSEKVLKILSSLLDMDWIAYHSSLKADIEWCIYVIKEQKIYQTNIQADKEELIEYVNWAVNEQLEVAEQEIPIKIDTYMNIPLYEKYGSEIESLLADSHKWDFDIFNFEIVTENQSLQIMTNHLLSLYNLYQILSFDNKKFMSFINEIQNGYHKDNFYHNATHAADVVQSFYYMLNTCQAIDICKLNDFDIGVCIISAAIHDYDHPGVNNIFLINTYHSLAIMYNDKSVLENFHVASAFKVLYEENNNFIEGVQKEDSKRFRMKCIGLVLATDFARHFTDLGKFQLRFSNCGVTDEEDRLLVMEMMMHASDIGNPSRPWKFCYEWANKVMNEFFAQGDKEREMGLTISNLCDRHSVIIPKAQIGFIELFIEPTFNILEIVLPNVNENVKYAIENKEHWKETMDNNNAN